MREEGALLCVAAALGLWGLSWGLPSRERLALVLPPGLDTPGFQKELEDSWVRMHQKLGQNLMLNPEAFATFTGVQTAKAGWTFPPPLLLNSVRSFYTRSAHEDEQTNLIVLSRMKPRALEFNPHFFAYGGAYIYALGAWLGAAAALRLVTLHGGLAPYLADPGKMGALYLAGRLFSFSAYAASALLLLRLGRRHFDAATGFLAGLLFLLLPTALSLAHTMKHYTYWTLLILLVVERSAALLESGGLPLYAAAGAASGAAVGAFIPGWPAVVVVASAAALRVGLKRGRMGEEAKGLALAALCSAAAFFITNPYWALDFKNAYAEIRGMNWVAPSPINPVRYVLGPLRRSMTAPAFAAIFASFLWALSRGKREPALLLVALAFALGMAATFTIANAPTSWSRYTLAWTAVGTLLAGRAVAVLARGRAWATALAAAMLVNQALEGLTYAQSFRRDVTRESNHVLAGRWIEDHVPVGETLGLLRTPQPASCPYFALNRYALKLVESRLFGSLPAAELPPYLVLTMPDYDDRPSLEPNLSRYERVASFGRWRLLPWLAVDPASITANPAIEIYKLKDHA